MDAKVAQNNPLQVTSVNWSKSPHANEVHTATPVVSEGNTNLSPAEKELLHRHQHLEHIAFKKVQHLMKSRVLVYSETTCPCIT